MKSPHLLLVALLSALLLLPSCLGWVVICNKSFDATTPGRASPAGCYSSQRRRGRSETARDASDSRKNRILCLRLGSKLPLASVGNVEVCRRRLVAQVLAATSALSISSNPLSTFPIAGADEPPPNASSSDILDRFGLDLSSSSPTQQQRSSRWPKESPSPLPTTKRSAQELTQDPDADPGAPLADDHVGGGENSDMQKAVKEALKRKQIDPRTHG
jgi:hypothetical protein